MTEDTLLDAEAVELAYGISERQLRNMRYRGGSPPYFKLGRRAFYRRRELDAWLAENMRRSTSDPGAAAGE